jgi:hypothetical protein
MKQNPTSPIQCKTTPRLQRYSTAGRIPPFLIAIALVLGYFALSLIALAKQPTPTPSPTPAGEDRGNGNTAAENVQALASNTTGTNNTATGWQSLYSNTEGIYNTATGFQALYTNTGNFNTANGVSALYFNTTGSNNTATGWESLYSNTEGVGNTANGVRALVRNVTGSYNTATGLHALYSSTGSFNTANGVSALELNIEGIGNTAVGYQALQPNTGNGNIALGFQAGYILTAGNSNIYIGNAIGVEAESDTIRIGSGQERTFIDGISGTPLVGAAVAINIHGQLGITVSSQRFKDDIKPMDNASDALFALKPVTFRYKKEIDPKRVSQFGLVAEDVEKVNPDLVLRDDNGKAYTVRYEAVNAMLLNEFLKEHRKVEQLKSTAVKQEATIAEMKKDFRASAAQLTAHLGEQQSQIQKISAQLELRTSTPQTIVENR